MSALPVHALGRLLWRPLTLWNLFLAAALCFALGRLAYVAGGGVDNLYLADAAQRLHSERMLTGMVPVLYPATLGALVGWAMWELLLAPFSVLLPGLRRALARALPAVAALCAVSTWALERVLGSGARSGYGAGWLGPPQNTVMVAEALLWFAIGVAMMDPLLRSRPALKWAAGALFAARLLGAAPAWAALTAWAALAGPLAAGAGMLLLWRALRAPALRARAAEHAPAADPMYRQADLRHGWSSASAARLQVAADAAAERPARFTRGSLRGPADWVRATLHEHFGWGSGGWLGGVCIGAVTTGLVMLTCVAMIGRREEGAGSESLARLLLDQLAVRETAGSVTLDGRMLPNMVGLIVALFVFYSPFVLVAPAILPLSRRDRAEAAWRTSVTQGLGMLAVVALLLALAGQVAALIEGAPRPALLSASLVRTLACLALLLPFAQACRLHFLDARLRRPGPFDQGLGAGLACIVLALGTQLLVAWWEDHRLLPSLTAEVLLMLALAALMQVLWRAVLVRHFRTAALG